MNPQPDFGDIMQGIREVIQLSSNIRKPCSHCSTGPGLDDDVGEGINHYLGHGFRILHVGQETQWAPDGKQLWHVTVAILGK
jgi:hypothetical protein